MQPPASETQSARLWSGIEDVYEAILVHPFVTGLTDGTLPLEAFRFYAVQDALYLREYARALSLCAARAPAELEIAMFASHAAGAIEVERSLHESFFAELAVTEQELASTPMAPTNLAYTSYLLSVAYNGSFAEALGAILPCYWIYWKVGETLLAQGSPQPLYRRWIETYGGDEFAEIVRSVLALTDRLGPQLSDGERARMATHFNTTSRYEWMFWDAGWHRETWPSPRRVTSHG
jgi:thiaminase/transcriptional activator TenA